jgi:23S rRNA pseudouridine2457 synthase
LLIALHKPYGMLSRFTSDGSRWRTLSELGLPSNLYPVGRLDADSEGLLLLTNETELNARLLDPGHRHPRVYWVQVERIPTSEALERLTRGVRIHGRQTLPCRAWWLEPQPTLPPRDPPIRHRKSVPDGWMGLELTEGRNRQVRRMTAAIGHPTLRLIRVRIGHLALGNLAPGRWRVLTKDDRDRAIDTVGNATLTH